MHLHRLGMRLLTTPIHPFVLLLSGTLGAALAVGCSSDSPAQQVPTSDAGHDSIDGGAQESCEGLEEGLGQCDESQVRGATVCENGRLVQYDCPAGTLCGELASEESEIACFCDDQADGLCPDGSCTNDPDCTVEPPSCRNANLQYTAGITDAGAIELHAPTLPRRDTLTLNGGLIGSIGNDRFLLVGDYGVGFGTGSISTWSENSRWKVVIHPRANNDLSPVPPSDILRISSGTLKIFSINGHLSGTLEDAIFTSESQPECSVSVATFSFDEPIVCSANGGCFSTGD